MDPTMDPSMDTPIKRRKSEGKRVYKRKEKNKDKEQDKEQEIRAPDSYKTETLADDLETIHLDSFQENSCDELEQAKLASLEESWKVNAACIQRWTSFQPFLQRLRQLCRYDPDIQTAYNLLSVVLYQFSYNVDASISEKDYIFIDKTVLHLRLTTEERANLYEALNRLRFEHENS